jgi:hypothetical protein
MREGKGGRKYDEKRKMGKESGIILLRYTGKKRQVKERKEKVSRGEVQDWGKKEGMGKEKWRKK